MTRLRLNDSTIGSSSSRIDVEQPVCGARIGVNQTFARPEWNAQLLEPGHKRLRDQGCEDRRMAAAGKVDDGPVLGDDAIDEAEVAGDAAEVIENPAGDEHHRDIAPARICDRAEHGWIRTVVARDRAVVVQRQN